jgi:hypothetical protein
MDSPASQIRSETLNRPDHGELSAVGARELSRAQVRQRRAAPLQHGAFARTDTARRALLSRSQWRRRIQRYGEDFPHLTAPDDRGRLRVDRRWRPLLERLLWIELALARATDVARERGPLDAAGGESRLTAEIRYLTTAQINLRQLLGMMPGQQPPEDPLAVLMAGGRAVR